MPLASEGRHAELAEGCSLRLIGSMMVEGKTPIRRGLRRLDWNLRETASQPGLRRNWDSCSARGGVAGDWYRFAEYAREPEPQTC